MRTSYGDRQRKQNPLAHEQARLIVDLTTELKLALEDRGLTQKDLSERLGTSASVVCRQINGRENLTLEKLAEIAFVLGKRFDFRLRELTRDTADRSHLRLAVSNQREHAPVFQLATPPEAAPTKHNTAA